MAGDPERSAASDHVGRHAVYAQDREPLPDVTVLVIQGTMREDGACTLGFGGGGAIGVVAAPLTCHVAVVDAQTSQMELHVGVRPFRTVVDGPGYAEEFANVTERFYPNTHVRCADLLKE